MAGAAGIDQADGVAVLMEVESERVTVATGGFQPGVQMRTGMFGQPAAAARRHASNLPLAMSIPRMWVACM